MGKSVTQVIAEHRGGIIARGMDEALVELVERVQETGKKGSLTIKVEISPHGKLNREIHLRISHNSKLPPPIDQGDESIWFGVRGELQRDDPDNRELFGPKGVELETHPTRQAG